MTSTATAASRFVRRTRLAAGEYRKNFRQLDVDVIAAVTSAEADRVTPLMSKIYLRLVSAPAEFWEREGVLYFSAGEREGQPVKASKVLYELLGVASATAHKALGWMHEQGIVGYFAGKNGAGIRVFINRAASSIGARAQSPEGKKILPFGRGSSGEGRGSFGEPAFNDSYAVSEVLETDLNPRAPKNGAAGTEPVGTTSSAPSRPQLFAAHAPAGAWEREPGEGKRPAGDVPLAEIVGRLRAELEPCLKEAATHAAARTASREMERTREWFETKALPKAVRVAQRETYNLLRRNGEVGARAGQGSDGLEVGRGVDGAASAARRLTPEEALEAAEICVALLEAQGKPIEVTLSEISSDSGGWLMPEDVAGVRELAEAMSHARGKS